MDVLPQGINALKLLRYNLSAAEVTPELESVRVAEYVRLYLEALSHGKELPDTELQPADDLVILAGQTYVSLWKLTGSEDHLYAAASILDYASAKSKQSYRIRLLLLRVYHLLGEHVRYVVCDSQIHQFYQGPHPWPLSSTD